MKQLKLLKDRKVKECSIMFTLERPITGKKLCHTIDDYHHFTPGTTKKVKSKHIEEPAGNILLMLMILLLVFMLVLFYLKYLEM